MTTPAQPADAPPVVLARWDDPATTWDSQAVVAAPVVAQATRLAGDIATYSSVRVALIWRGDLREPPRIRYTPLPPAGLARLQAVQDAAAPSTPASPIDRWPTSLPPTQEPTS